MNISKMMGYPVAALLLLSGCDTMEDANTVPEKGNVNGIVLIPQALDANTSLSCVNVPIPGGYGPLADANVSLLDANGSVVLSGLTTDSCGRVYRNVNVDPIAAVLVSKTGYRTMYTDIRNFTLDDQDWGLVSTIEDTNTFQVRVNDAGESLTYQSGSKTFKYSVVDSTYGRPVIGIPGSFVKLYKGKEKDDITSYQFYDLDADVILTLDASGSMASEVYDENETLLGDRFDLTYDASKAFINLLGGRAQLGITIFSSDINFVDREFLNETVGFTTTDEASVTVPYATDGFEDTKQLSRFAIDVYHYDSTIYGGTLAAEFDYLAESDYLWNGGTMLYDAAYEAAERLSKRDASRRISVLMTDGYDSGLGLPSFAKAITLAKEENIIFYTIAIGEDVSGDELEDLADQTGGTFVQATGADISDKFSEILGEIQYYYEIGADVDDNSTDTYRVDVALDGEIFSGVVELNGTAGGSATDAETTIHPGAALYAKCIPCHGSDAQNSAYGVTGIINSWPQASIEEALFGYRANSRDLYGYGDLMFDQVKTYSDDDVKNLAEYITTLAK